jgi:hypothetical protein
MEQWICEPAGCPFLQVINLAVNNLIFNKGRNSGRNFVYWGMDKLYYYTGYLVINGAVILLLLFFVWLFYIHMPVSVRNWILLPFSIYKAFTITDKEGIKMVTTVAEKRSNKIPWLVVCKILHWRQQRQT